MSDQLTAKINNYQGSNSFILKMKGTLTKYPSLTPKQREAVEKIFNSQHSITKDCLPEDLKKIVEYKGENKFVKDISEKFQKYGTITDKQKSAALDTIKKESEPVKMIHPNLPTIGDTIKVGRKTGQDLKTRYNLKFNPILLDVTKIVSVTPKAVKLVGKMTIKRGDVCVCCAKTLTDEFSMLTKMGKLCAKHMGMEYITDKSQAEKFREEYLKRVEEIGEMEFWIPLSQIKKWEGDADMVLKMIRINNKPINFNQ
jgi:hypothetical protein